MTKKANNQIEGIIDKTTIWIYNLFDKNNDYVNNISGIAKETGISHVTIRKHLTIMVNAGIMKELFVGNNGKVFSLNRDSPTTKGFIGLINALGENYKK